MSQQPYDGRAPEPGRPYYPPPQFPPPQFPPPGQQQSGPPQPAYGNPYQGAQQGQPYAPGARPTPLWGLTIPAAILAFPIGLIAVYFSSQVNQRLQAGDIVGATKNAGLAKTCLGPSDRSTGGSTTARRHLGYQQCAA